MRWEDFYAACSGKFYMYNILLFKFVSLPLEDKTSGSVLEYPISFSKVLGLIVCTGNYYLRFLSAEYFFCEQPHNRDHALTTCFTFTLKLVFLNDVSLFGIYIILNPSFKKSGNESRKHKQHSWLVTVWRTLIIIWRHRLESWMNSETIRRHSKENKRIAKIISES